MKIPKINFNLDKSKMLSIASIGLAAGAALIGLKKDRLNIDTAVENYFKNKEKNDRKEEDDDVTDDDDYREDE